MKMAEKATKFAATKAGFEVLRIINEPTAAAIFYHHNTEKKEAFNLLTNNRPKLPLENNTNKPAIYAVYDFGGGTFDCSIVSVKSGVYCILASYGDLHLGGDDIDKELEKIILKKIHNISEDCLNKSLLMARNIKEELSHKEKSNLIFEGQSITISRKEFEEAIAPIINKTINITKNTLRAASINAEQLSAIVLVGGSSKIPLISTKLKKEFSNIKINFDEQPDFTVVKGATIQSANIMSKKGYLLVDVVPLSLGIETFGGIKETIIPNKHSDSVQQE